MELFKNILVFWVDKISVGRGLRKKTYAPAREAHRNLKIYN